MKKTLIAISMIGLFALSCGSPELEAEVVELRTKVSQLEKDLKASKIEADEQKKTAEINKQEADVARARAEALLKDCK